MAGYRIHNGLFWAVSCKAIINATADWNRNFFINISLKGIKVNNKRHLPTTAYKSLNGYPYVQLGTKVSATYNDPAWIISRKGAKYHKEKIGAAFG
jgi:hypothetical protein